MWETLFIQSDIYLIIIGLQIMTYINGHRHNVKE